MLYNRQSTRLKEYDYTRAGAYFVSICSQNRQCLFGQIIDVGAGPCACPETHLSKVGLMVQSIWNKIPKFYAGIETDEFKIMPNHIHGIIIIDELKGQARGVAPTTNLSLPDIVYRFKSITTKKYIDGVKQNLWKPFDGKLWQRNYYEHIIRNEADLQDIRQYIINNPINWATDRNNPLNL